MSWYPSLSGTTGIAMSVPNAARLPSLRTRRRPIAAAFAGLIGVHSATYFQPSFAGDLDKSPRPSSAAPSYAPSSWMVLNCNDAGSGSLRAILQDPMLASGDTIDLSQLPTLCGAMDSVITLTTGELGIAQSALTLVGPTNEIGTVTISGGQSSRVINHMGGGTLSLESLTIRDGYYHAMGAAFGGCVYSKGMLDLNRTTVSDCLAISDASAAKGAGIFSISSSLILSSITGNQAIGPTANGGGVFAQNSVTTKYSSISHNTASGANVAQGGGTYSGRATITSSTIDHNFASTGGAIVVKDAGINTVHSYVYNSTIYANSSHAHAAIFVNAAQHLVVSGSTIASNHVAGPEISAAGIDIAFGLLTLESSIVATNTFGPLDTPADISVTSPATLEGADNLVIASNSSPPGVITVTSDPKLSLLQFNGGRTLTQALLAGSPAIGMGNNQSNRTYDQRGTGYPRASGPSALVDIGAFQFDSIFAGDLEF